MSDTMMQEILKRLDLLAEKLGAGGEVVWATLIRQQVMVKGWLGLWWLVPWIAGAVLAIIGAKWCWRERAETVNGSGDREMFTFFAWVLAGATVILCGFSLYVVYDSMAHILNPQYYALQELSKMLTGK